jgi:type IV secretory pathway TraG/TraD family ATPase VirD4
VFKILINFILNMFSRGEASYGTVKLKHRILFLIDEFPVLGYFPFLSKTMGILAGYGINFYIIVQALNQIIDLYGQHHTFLDNCKTVCLFAPGKIEDAKMFSEMIGKESVVKESLSTSGHRYSVALNHLNASSQEVARDLMNPDELMKLPPTEAIVYNQGTPPYIGKKVVYYMDERFKDLAWTGKPYKGRLSGRKPPTSRKELEKEIERLPSYTVRQRAPLNESETKQDSEADSFQPEDYIEILSPAEEAGWKADPLRYKDCPLVEDRPSLRNIPVEDLMESIIDGTERKQQISQNLMPSYPRS